MNIDNLLNTFNNELNEIYKTNDGVYHLGDRPKSKIINYNLLTVEQLEARKEYFNELIERAKLNIDEINDTIRVKKKSVSNK